MTEQIIQLRSALQASNRSLERRVEERTAELQKALERVSELSQLKANFISNISHELRTPLTHIKGYIELLVSESLGPLSDEQKHALAVSQQSTNRLETLIDDLIMVSMASRGVMSLKQEPVDICRLANLTVKSSAGSANRTRCPFAGRHWTTMSPPSTPIRRRSPGCWASSSIMGSNSPRRAEASPYPSNARGKTW